MPKVSVVIPVYNQEAYLADCIDSVLAQTLGEIEAVCVDDGSTDRSGTMLDDRAARDPRLRVVHQANAGAGAARNAGLAVATGDFVAFMDPDDAYPDERVLEDLWRGAVDHGVAACGGGMVTTEGPLEEDGFVFPSEGIVSYDDYQFELGYVRFVYRRSMLASRKIVFPNIKRFQDVPFFVEAMHAAHSFYALRRNTYLYRVGHQRVEWSADHASKAVDNVKGMLAVRDLAMKYGYARMVARSDRRLADFIRLMGSEANGLRRHRDELIGELADLKTSVSFRLGRFLTAPLRLCRDFAKGKNT